MTSHPSFTIDHGGCADCADLRELLAEAQLLFALGVGAMTDNGDKDNQERCIREGGELMLRISKRLCQ